MNTTENEAAAQTASLVEFSDEALRKLYSIGELQHFSSGNVMVGEGETEYSVYIVLDGQAHVTLARPKGPFTLAVLEPGSIFGELSFFDRMPRSAQVSVLEDCSVLKISEGAFKQLLEQDPETAVAFMMEMSRILSLRLRKMNQLVQTLLS